MTLRPPSAGWSRIVTVVATLLAVSFVYARTEPAVADAQLRLKTAELTLRSGEVASAAAPRLRAELRRIEGALGDEFHGDPEAQTLAALALVARRHHLQFASTQSVSNAPAFEPGTDFDDVHLMFELHGGYREGLSAIDELTRQCPIVRVESVSLRRGGERLILDIGVAVLHWRT